MTPAAFTRALASIPGSATEEQLDEAHQLVCDLAREIRKGNKSVKVLCAYDDALVRYQRRAAKLTKGTNLCEPKNE